VPVAESLACGGHRPIGRQACKSGHGKSGGDGEFTKLCAALVKLNCVPEAGRQFVAVGDAKQCGVIFCGDFEEQAADVCSRLWIKIPSGFVGKQQRGLVN
jgi:hypothetical protein